MKKWICSLLVVCGAVVAAPVDDGMYATLQTTLGDVCFELYYTNVPRIVANFVSLAEGTRPWIDPRTTFVSKEPYYNGLTFHRVIAGFMIQGGSPKGDGSDGPGYSFEDEFDLALRHDRPGMVSMANSGPDSNGGQFFITVANTDWLDDVHSVFGSVVEGMDIVSNIASVAVDANDKPLTDVVITNVFITRNGTNALSFAVTNQALPEVSAIPMTINGLGLVTGTATSIYQYVYLSTNLSDWSEGASDYWPEPNGDWNLTASGEPREYFHANRVVYTPDTNVVSETMIAY
jgi:peptidyl-prolyl cis-trans isomerase A (cyclophilin A)